MATVPQKTLTISIYSSAAMVIAALCCTGGRFYGSPGDLSYLLSFLAPILLTTAAFTLSKRSLLANSMAVVASLLGLNWLYLSETNAWGLANSWIFFNLPDRELAWQPFWPIAVRILSVAMLVLSASVAMFRSIPES